MLLLLLSCAPQQPPACAQMCTAAADLYGACLAAWGVDWSAAGYADEDAFLASCDTWGWELAVLEADAIARGVAEAGALSATCTEREAAMSAEDAPCGAFTDIDWHTPPWDEAAVATP